MKYLLLMHPSNSNDCYVMNDKEFDTVDEAVREAIAYGTDDFWVIIKQEWKAVSDEPK